MMKRPDLSLVRRLDAGRAGRPPRPEAPLNNDVYVGSGTDESVTAFTEDGIDNLNCSSRTCEPTAALLRGGPQQNSLPAVLTAGFLSDPPTHRWKPELTARPSDLPPSTRRAPTTTRDAFTPSRFTGSFPTA